MKQKRYLLGFLLSIAGFILVMFDLDAYGLPLIGLGLCINITSSYYDTRKVDE